MSDPSQEKHPLAFRPGIVRLKPITRLQGRPMVEVVDWCRNIPYLDTEAFQGVRYLYAMRSALANLPDDGQTVLVRLKDTDTTMIVHATELCREDGTLPG